MIEDRWGALEVFIKAYTIFGKIDRHCADVILKTMDELQEAYPV
jgi:hypothetical protein